MKTAVVLDVAAINAKKAAKLLNDALDKHFPGSELTTSLVSDLEKEILKEERAKIRKRKEKAALHRKTIDLFDG